MFHYYIFNYRKKCYAISRFERNTGSLETSVLVLQMGDTITLCQYTRWPTPKQNMRIKAKLLSAQYTNIAYVKYVTDTQSVARMFYNIKYNDKLIKCACSSLINYVCISLKLVECMCTLGGGNSNPASHHTTRSLIIVLEQHTLSCFIPYL